jgi:c-di-GMP-binding flagellar brake protein YcgR
MTKGQAADERHRHQTILAAACARNVPVEIHHRDHGDGVNVCKSRLIRMDDANLYLDRPQCIGGAVAFHKDQSLSVYFALDEQLYMFRARVVNEELLVKLNEHKMVLGIALTRPDGLESGQRRLSYRVSLAAADEIAVDLHGASSADPNACPLNARRFSGRLVDLSLGGAALRVRGAVHTSFRHGECFFMSFELPGEEGELRCLAQVRQSRDIQNGAATRLGVRFIPWPTETSIRQQQVVLQRFVTKVQRARLKRAS